MILSNEPPLVTYEQSEVNEGISIFSLDNEPPVATYKQSDRILYFSC